MTGRTFPTDLLAALIEHDSIGVVAGRGSEIIYGNARLHDILGLPDEADWTGLCLPEYTNRDVAALAELERLGQFQYEKEFLRGDGTRVPVMLSGVRVPDDRFDWVATVTDLTELRESQYRASLAERTLAEQDAIDRLTGLGTELVLLTRIERATIRARWDPPGYGLLVCEVAQYAGLTSTVSRAEADAYLARVAIQLVNAGAGLVTRLDAGRFAILCARSMCVVDVLDVARRVQAKLAVQPDAMTLSIGLAMGPVGSAEELLCQAQAALGQALERGPGTIAVYEPHLHAQSMERLRLAHELPGAIERGELEIYYQPIVALDDECAVGVEALLRWHHPRRGFLSPAEFIPVAEEYGPIFDIGVWVLQQSCAWAHDNRPLQVNVNVSPRQLGSPSLVPIVAAALKSTGLAPSSLTLEVTENSLVHDLELADRQIRDLKALGVQLAIDDFGVGYCSLSYLKRFPVDELKIDRLFVQGVTENGLDHAIVAAVVALAGAIGAKVVAEGVVSSSQIGVLRHMGVALAQGYFWSPAVPAAEFPAVVAGLGTKLAKV